MKEFKCPKCEVEGSKFIECVLDGFHRQTVESIDENGCVIYGHIESEGSVERFQCDNCGYILRLHVGNDNECLTCQSVIDFNLNCDYLCYKCGSDIGAVANEEELMEWIEKNC